MKTFFSTTFLVLFLLALSSAGFSQNASDLIARARASIESKNYDSAITDLTQAVKLEKKNALAYSLRGDAYLLKKEVALARADYDKAIKLEPKNSGFYYKRGLSFREAPGNSRELVMADLSKAIELDPMNESALRERGTGYYLTFRPEDRALALGDLERALTIDPRDPVAWGIIARVYVLTDNAEKALEAYQSYIALKPEDPYAYVERGHIYEFLKKYDLAIADYTRTIKILPNDVIGYGNRGGAFFKTNKLRLALADYDKSVELRPKDSSSYSERGIVLEAQGKYDLAVKDYQKALELMSSNAVAKARLDGAIEKHNAAVARYESIAPGVEKLYSEYKVYAIPLDKKLYKEFTALDDTQRILPHPDTKMMCGKLAEIRGLMKNAKAAFVPIRAMYDEGKFAGFTESLIFIENAIDGFDDSEQYIAQRTRFYHCAF